GDLCAFFSRHSGKLLIEGVVPMPADSGIGNETLFVTDTRVGPSAQQPEQVASFLCFGAADPNREIDRVAFRERLKIEQDFKKKAIIRFDAVLINGTRKE